MKLDLAYDGTTYTYDTEQMSLAEAFTVKTITGDRPGAFTTALLEMDPHAILAALLLARRRAGDVLAADDIDREKVDVIGFAAAARQTIDAEVMALTAKPATTKPAVKRTAKPTASTAGPDD